MTREEYAKIHLPELKTLIDLVTTDFLTGQPIFVNVTEESFRPDLELWWRKYLAKSYNDYVALLFQKQDFLAARKEAAAHKIASDKAFEAAYDAEERASDANTITKVL
jgi:hypothetical protein